MRFIHDKAKELEEKVKTISSSDVISLFHDNDPDGVASAVILEKYLISLGFTVSFRISPSFDKPFSSKFTKQLLDVKTTVLFVLDYNVEAYGVKKEYEEFVKNYSIKSFVFDHHKYASDLEAFFYCNSAFLQNQIEPSQYCTSKIVYDVVSSIWEDAKKYNYIASIGMIGDWNHKTWGLFIQESIKSQNSFLKKFYAKQNLHGRKKFEDFEFEDFPIPKTQDDFFASPLGKIALFIFYGCSKGEKDVRFVYSSLLSEENILHLIEIVKKYSDVEEEIDEYFDYYNYIMKTTSSKQGDFSIFELEIESKYDILAITSNLFSLKDSNTVFFFYTKILEGYHISVRRGKKGFPIGDILHKVALQTHSVGGGNDFAGGAKVSKSQFISFKQLFYKECEKELSNTKNSAKKY